MIESTSPPSRVIRASAFAVRWLWRLLLAVFLLLSLAWGVLQFWIVPRIADLRPRLETLASQALGVPVRVASIEARPGLLVPSFELQGVQLLDAGGREVLRLPRVMAALSAGSLLRLDFEQLYVEQPVLEVRRTAEGRILVAGLDFFKEESGDAAAADWFFSLSEFVIRGATVRWLDERRDAGALALTGVDVVLRNGPRHHDMRVDATPPDGWGQRFTLAGKFRRPLLSTRAGRWADWDGQLYASFSHVDLSRLRRYVSLGPGVDVQEGEGALRAWVDVSRGVPLGGAADLALGRVRATLGPGLDPLDLRGVTGRLGGKLLAGGFQFYTEGLQFEAQDGAHWPGGNVSVTHTQGEGRLPAMGNIRADRLDLLALSRIASSLPLGTVTHEALLAHPVKGLVESLQARWQGPLAAPTNYELRARASGLDIAALPASMPGSAVRGTATDAVPSPGLPGLRGATVDIDVNHTGGRARLTIAQGALEFPGVFEDPLLPVDQLSADARWQIQGERIVMNQFRLKLANADAEGEFTGNWQTGGAGRTLDGARFPGVLDLQGQFVRADGARVHRYLPLGIPASARHYVRDAIVKASLDHVNVRVKGELARVPFADSRDGEFRFSGNVKDATFVYVPAAIAPRGQLPWPELRALGGVLVFDRGGMRVQGASARLTGQPGLRIDTVEARLPDFLNRPTVVVGFDVRGPAKEMIDVVNGSPLGALTDRALERATATGDAGAHVKLTVPIDAPESTRVLGSVTFAGNDLRMSPETPLLAKARGVVSFSDTGFNLSGAQARIYGGDARIEGGTRPSQAGRDNAVLLRAQGNVTAEGLRQAPELGYVAKLAAQATGSTAYSAVLGVRRGVPELSVTSNLQGLALNLPAPFGKAAEAAMALRLESAIEAGTSTAPRLSERVQFDLGSLVSAHYVREREGDDVRVLRGSIAVGLSPQESAPQPAQGVAANINLAALNLDLWESLLSGGAAHPATASTPVTGSPMQSYLPTSLALRAGRLTFGGRSFDDVVVGGTRDHLTWRGNISASQLDGHVEYRQSSGAGDGRLHARLARLVVPREATSGVETLLDQQPSVLPTLDVVVDDFELRGRKLGRLEIEAVNRAAEPGQDTIAREWRLSKLNLAMPEATLSATGNWAALGAQAGGVGRAPSRGTPARRTAMKFNLDIADAGALLERLGMKDVIRRGKGRMEGVVTWNGSPVSPDYPTMGGQINVNVENGQFLKAEPGIAKLLGVLSLQALPRRLTLDFRDVFSDGFSFDFVRGDMAIARGVATTNNLQMKGVNAAVLMDGRADLVRETQDVRVIVVPEINAGTASLVATVINPAIGLGSVLAQLFLRRPLIKAATQEFHVDGSWSDPRVTRVTTDSGAPPTQPVTPETAQP